MSDIKHLVHTGIKITIASLTDVLREYKMDTEENPYETGYNRGIDEAIKAVQLFQKKLEEQEAKLND
jgi:uncharacterized protein YqgV (UPF0045/DUF77 family)